MMDSQGKGWPIRLMQAAGVKVIRWRKIRSDANPYDPAWGMRSRRKACRQYWYGGKKCAGRTTTRCTELPFPCPAEAPRAIHEVLGTKDGGSRSCRQASMHALR